MDRSAKLAMTMSGKMHLAPTIAAQSPAACYVKTALTCKFQLGKGVWITDSKRELEALHDKPAMKHKRQAETKSSCSSCYCSCFSIEHGSKFTSKPCFHGPSWLDLKLATEGRDLCFRLGIQTHTMHMRLERSGVLILSIQQIAFLEWHVSHNVDLISWTCVCGVAACCVAKLSGWLQTATQACNWRSMKIPTAFYSTGATVGSCRTCGELAIGTRQSFAQACRLV